MSQGNRLTQDERESMRPAEFVILAAVALYQAGCISQPDDQILEQVRYLTQVKIKRWDGNTNMAFAFQVCQADGCEEYEIYPLCRIH